MHTIDHFGNDGSFSSDQVIIQMYFVCSLAKQHTVFK